MQTYNLSDIVFFQEGPGIRSSQFTGSGMKLLNVRNIVNGKMDLSNTETFISADEAYGKYKHFLLDGDEIVIASSGIKVDYFDKKVCYADKEQLPAMLNTSTIRLRSLDENILAKEFLFYFMKSNIFKNQIQRLITGSAQLNFGPSHLKQIAIPLPPLATQRAIAEKLDKLQSLIDLKKQAITKTDELAKSIFLEMFGDPMKNEKGREVKKLDDVAVITMGQSPDGESYNTTGDGIPFFQGKAEFTDKYPIVKKRTTKPTKYAKVDDILMSVRAPVGDINLCNVDCCIGRGLASIRADKVNLKYLYWILIFLKDSISDLGTGSTFKAISSNQLKTIQIIIPPLPIQQKFADIITQIEAQKSEHKLALAKLEELYQAEMQKSFSL